MLRIKIGIITAMFFACIVAHCQTQESLTIFPKGELVKNGNFTGSVWLHMLVATDSTFNTQIAIVAFAPGARTNWHYHPSGQILIITDGVAYYQEKGKQIQHFKKGEVIKCSPGTQHWHGAAPDTPMTHIVCSPNMEKGSVVWLEKVTEDEYQATK